MITTHIAIRFFSSVPERFCLCLIIPQVKRGKLRFDDVKNFCVSETAGIKERIPPRSKLTTS